VRVALGAGPVVGERRAAVLGHHDAAELDADEEALGAVRVGRDPAHVMGPRPRREAPARARGDVLQRLELGPRAAVAGDEQAARLRAGVQRAVGSGDGDREDVGRRQRDALPRRARVAAQPRAVPERARQHGVAARGDALQPLAREHGLGQPRAALAAQAQQAIAGAEVGGHGSS
jgi:hypothetical protein